MKNGAHFIHWQIRIALTILAVTASAQSGLAVYFEQFAPYSFGQHDQVKGYFVDVLNEAVAKRAGISLKHQGMPWKRAQAMVANGQADLMVTAPTTDRLAYSDKISPAIQVEQLRFYTLRSHPELKSFYKIKQLEDARPFRIGAYFGSGWVQAHLTGYKVDAARDFTESIDKLLIGRIDLIPDLHETASWMIRDRGVRAEVVELPLVLDTLPFHIMIGKRSPLFSQKDRIATALQGMQSDGTLARLKAKHGIGN
ncbi:transporter substrate-binding domain-containing protein [Burkholderiaceae bacterium DAT-1]|nr:transporter substrate-binding domain-containing protein [Burkholderiaceae bacterium DAT-1]